ncbi:hypothetical protein RUND412_000770, partial [Rhizina undulata]
SKADPISEMDSETKGSPSPSYEPYLNTSKLPPSFLENWNILRSHRFTGKDCGGLTQEIAFYAVMGGYSIDTHSEWRNKGENTLTPESFLELLQAKILSTDVLNHEDIHYRSKTDLLGKILICIQTGWLVLQCIARKIEGLPISLLEIHTVIHVVCALAIYGFWTKKPLNVRNSTKVDKDSHIDADILDLLILQFYNNHGYRWTVDQSKIEKYKSSQAEVAPYEDVLASQDLPPPSKDLIQPAQKPTELEDKHHEEEAQRFFTEERHQFHTRARASLEKKNHLYTVIHAYASAPCMHM